MQASPEPTSILVEDSPESAPAVKKPYGVPAYSNGVFGSAALSRDEMNLAEFPLTVLSTRADPKVKTLEFSDFLRLKNGETIERKWIITGADKFGLPTSTDDDVILGLIRLSMDDGFRNQKVYFSRYELLKALRWSTEGRSYSRLTKSLDRLSGVRIRATNSFYDNSSKSYQTCNFGVIDAYEINDERAKKDKQAGEGTKSFFIWSEMIFDSFRAGFIKKLDLDLYFSLKSAVSRRLYRYLDKHFYFKSTIEKPLLLLAFEKLGLSRSYRYVSSVKQQLDPAIEELTRVGFLSSCEIAGKGEQAVIRFIAGKQTVVPGTLPIQPTQPRAPNARDEMIEALVSRGITIQQAKRLLESRSAADLEAIDRIVQYYDQLVEANDPKVSRSKVGFLYRAVESPYKFTIPQQRSGAGAGNRPAPRVQKPEHRIVRAERSPEGGKETREGETDARRKGLYQDFIEREIASGVRSLGAGEISRIHAEVEKKMECLKSALSPERFREALNGCVKEQLVRVLGLPNFSAWAANN